MELVSVGALFELLPQLQDWLKQQNCKADISRFSHYKSLASDFFSCENPLSPEGEQKFINLSNSIHEVLLAILVMQAAKDHDWKIPDETLQKIVNGPDFVEEAASGESRNFLYELLVARFLSNHNFLMNFFGKSDVQGLRDGFIINAECKKLYSITQLWKKLKKSGLQLNRTTGTNRDEVSGLTFLDLSFLLKDEIKTYEYDHQSSAHEKLKSEIDAFSNAHKKMIRKYTQAYSQVSLGVSLFASKVIWTKNIEAYLIMHQTIISTSDAGHQILEKLFPDG